MQQYSFERMEVWQLARDLTARMYKVARRFPSDERFHLVDQLRRSAASVPANIAEGSGRSTGKDKAHFSKIAYGSLVEVLNHLLIAVELEYLSREEVNAMRPEIHTVAAKLSRLRRAQLNQGKPGKIAREPEAPYGDDLPPLLD